MVSAPRQRRPRHAAATFEYGAAVPFATGHGMGSVPVYKERPTTNEIFITQARRRPVVERTHYPSGLHACACDLGILDFDPADLGSLVCPKPRGFHTDPPAPRRCGEGVVDCSVCERGYMRGTGISRLLPAPIRCTCAQSMDSVDRAGGAVRDQPRLSGHRGLRENCVIRPFVWRPGTVAQQFAARHGGARLGRYCQWHLWNLGAS